MSLGGGRSKKGDRIDHAVGIVLRRKVGDRVERGVPLLTLHAEEPERFEEARARLLGAVVIGSREPVPVSLVHRIIK
jgi:pyrimidine-nucleoside phosphorylase